MNFTTPGYEDLELSTQILIKEALKRDIHVDVLDRKDNFISLKKGGHIEYVKQATRTSADTYISPLIMENKHVTKIILSQHGINVPEGTIYDDIKQALSQYHLYKGKSMVVKPKSTNYGIGITIMEKINSEKEYSQALDNAFKHDSAVMVETFIPGKEYRFLVINDEVVAVLHRVPANVTGDGIKNIYQLIEEKNRTPLRGTAHKTPLEKIKTGQEEAAFLKLQGKDFTTIPLKGEQVFLRKNSNISTGGDSIDYTDSVSQSYKNIAVNAAKVVGAKICGADLIISDLEEEPHMDNNGQYNYGVIELNFNPAIHMHEFPWQGERPSSEKKILNLLGF